MIAAILIHFYMHFTKITNSICRLILFMCVCFWNMTVYLDTKIGGRPDSDKSYLQGSHALGHENFVKNCIMFCIKTGIPPSQVNEHRDEKLFDHFRLVQRTIRKHNV